MKSTWHLLKAPSLWDSYMGDGLCVNGHSAVDFSLCSVPFSKAATHIMFGGVRVPCELYPVASIQGRTRCQGTQSTATEMEGRDLDGRRTLPGLVAIDRPHAATLRPVRALSVHELTFKIVHECVQC